MSNPQVELHIANYGVVTLELDTEKAPKSVANFLSYVNKGHYNNTLFHRVIPGFMVQGGGMEPGMKEKRGDKPIDNEANNGLKNLNYTVAMARTGDPHSATAQFFINVADNGFLNHTGISAQGWGYAVFGKVIAGTEVVDKIKAVKTARRGHHDDVPVEDVILEKAVAL
ncbi:MAG: peptidyl-prolyl cis-trans isomerase [Rhodoferax sp.]|jgi:peptidyl-prolyl cis-trans isomerase B (cyclophilin B)|nr:peptidyl-prolyl cis-trans isomerase [Rhodoferax sp.]